MGQSPTSEYYNNKRLGTPFMQGNRTFGFKFPTFDTYTTVVTKLAFPNDIIMSVRAPVGALNITPIKMCLGRGLCSLRSKNNDQTFLYYLLKYYSNDLVNKETGTVFGSISYNDIANLSVFIPEDVDIQQKIAAVLSALDDKIELNNKINKNLEEQAQVLFKSWFIDFEPFDGKRPEDWEQGCLLDIARYLNGLAMQKFRPTPNEENIPVLKIKELRQGFCDSNSDLCSANIDSSYIVEDGDVIFSWSGSLLVDIWCGGRAGLNQHLFKVSSNKYDKWFYYSWTKYHLDHFISVAADKATTMGHIKRNELEKAEVIIPSSIYLQKIGQIIAPMYDLIIKNRIENSRLAALRDALLPKLMSGEIDVSKVDISDPDYVEKLSCSGA